MTASICVECSFAWSLEGVQFEVIGPSLSEHDDVNSLSGLQSCLQSAPKVKVKVKAVDSRTLSLIVSYRIVILKIKSRGAEIESKRVSNRELNRTAILPITANMFWCS